MKIAMANDHAGTALKNAIKAYLESEGHEVKDFGTLDLGFAASDHNPLTMTLVLK